MNFAEQLLSDCEEFFELSASDTECDKLDRATEALRNFLERQSDGWTNYSDEELARATQCRLMEIWRIIPASQKLRDPNLRDYYDELVTRLEETSGFETDYDEGDIA